MKFSLHSISAFRQNQSQISHWLSQSKSEVIMKRAKRDQHKQAFSRGRVSGLRGHSLNVCPFQTSEKRLDWIEGWRIGHAEHTAGFRNWGVAS